MKPTSIEWVKNSDGTQGYALNLWIGCTKISPACNNCYAEVSRVAVCMGSKWGDNEPRIKCKTAIKQLFQLNKLAEKQGIKIRVFINQNSDFYDNKAPQEWRDEFFDVVEQTPFIDYILVTKRIGNAKLMMPQSWLDNGYPANVWQLITVCNQSESDRDIPKLLELNVSVRGLSIEPMLGEIDLSDNGAKGLPIYWEGNDGEIKIYCGLTKRYLGSRKRKGWSKYSWVKINWIVVGGESGKNARPMNPDWARKIRDQCVCAGVPFFHKQNGEWSDSESANITLAEIAKLEHHIFEIGSVPVYKVGKKRAGNLLDGKVWQQMPV